MARFLYLFQVERDLPPALERAMGDDSDLLFLSWGARSDDPRSLYYPSSSWTQGRNRLLKAAETRDYEYLILADDDIVLELLPQSPTAGADPWRTFETFLRTRQPAVGVPHYPWHLTGGVWNPQEECQTIRFFDAIFNAFHREVVATVLPYCDLFDEHSETYSQNLLCSVVADVYPGQVLQTNRVHVRNLLGRRDDREFLLATPEQFYLDALRTPALRHRFRRHTLAGATQHPTMGPARPRSGSYAVPADVLTHTYDLSHPLWTRRQELRALPASDAFYSDDPDSPRAVRWRHHRATRVRPPGPPPSPLREALRAAGLSWAFPIARRVKALTRPLRTTALRDRIRAARRRRDAQRRWRAWWRNPACVYDFPELDQDRVLAMLAEAINIAGAGPGVFIDVGAAQGHVLMRVLSAGLQRPLCAIGIDPVDTRAYLDYSGFVTAAIRSGDDGHADFYRMQHSDCSSLLELDASAVTHDPAHADGTRYFSPGRIEDVDSVIRVPTSSLSTIVEQYGLADAVLDFVKIDAQGSDLDVFRSLGPYRTRCLFVRIESVLPGPDGQTRRLYHGQSTFAEDCAELESAGFRMLNIGRFGVTPEADVTWVNGELFARLCAPLTH